MAEPARDASSARLTLVEASWKANEFMGRAKAKSTLRAYESDWRDFVSWCFHNNVSELSASPRTIGAYLAEIAGSLKTGTVERRLVAIAYERWKVGADTPVIDAGVREVVKGIRRTYGTYKEGKRALSVSDIRDMVQALPRSVAGTRDRAVLLLGFAGAFRRGELVGLDVSDVEEVKEGLIISVRHSKTDQHYHGAEVGIARGQNLTTCPVEALSSWLDASGITGGPLFRPVDRTGHVRRGRLSSCSVALIVRRAANLAGMNADQVAELGAHSLRSGLATSAAQAGVEERLIMAQGRWRTVASVRGYIRRGSIFAQNPSARLGL